MKYKDIINKMTIEEKAMLCVGQDYWNSKGLERLGIPSIKMSDGPHGLRVQKTKADNLGINKSEVSTCFPSGATIANSWDKQLAYKMGKTIGEEAVREEVDIVLGPGVNIKRSPLCGRNFEYFSEDPYLSGKMGAFISKGIAKHGAFATIKHFCCNNQEKSRSDYDVVVSQRALREIYLKPFEIAVKEGKNVLIMTSYNSVNGFWSASNYDLTAKILRDEWGFDNIVMTDWWARCNAKQGEWGSTNRLDVMVRSQNDLYMVSPDVLVKSSSVLKGLENGTVTRAQLQLSCKRILEWILKTNTFKEYLKRGCKPKYPIVVNTDDMTMVAITNDFDISEACIKSINAGADLLLICHGYETEVDVINNIKDAVDKGIISIDRINESVYRILSLKYSYKINNEKIENIDVDIINSKIEDILNRLNKN